MSRKFKALLKQFVTVYDIHRKRTIAAAEAELARKQAEIEAYRAKDELQQQIVAMWEKASRNRIPALYRLPDGRIAGVQKTGIWIRELEEL